MMKFRSPFVTERKDYQDNDRSNARNKLFKAYDRIFGYHDVAFRDLDPSLLRRLYSDARKGNPIVFSIIDKRARLTAEVFEYVKIRDIKTKEIIEGHPVMKTLHYPNDEDTTMSGLVKHLSIDKDVMGEVFAYLDGKTALTPAKKIYPLPTEYVDIKMGGFKQPITGFRLIEGDDRNLMLPSEVMWIKNYNPDPNVKYHGLSPLVTASRLLEMIEQGDKRILNLVSNGGVKNILTPKPLTGDGAQFGLNENDIDEEQDLINDAENAGKTRISRIPLDIVKLGETATDLGILATSEFAIKVLCFIYDYPYEMFLGTAKYSNQKEAKKLLYTQIGIPQARIICAALTRSLGLEAENKEFFIDIDSIDALQEDKSALLSAHVLARTSVNERRDVLGLERYPDKQYDEPIMMLSDQLGYIEDDGLGLDDGGDK